MVTESQIGSFQERFFFQGAKAFNNLPLHARQMSSIVHFKSTLKQMNSF